MMTSFAEILSSFSNIILSGANASTCDYNWRVHNFTPFLVTNKFNITMSMNNVLLAQLMKDMQVGTILQRTLFYFPLFVSVSVVTVSVRKVYCLSRTPVFPCFLYLLSKGPRNDAGS